MQWEFTELNEFGEDGVQEEPNFFVVLPFGGVEHEVVTRDEFVTGLVFAGRTLCCCGACRTAS